MLRITIFLFTIAVFAFLLGHGGIALIASCVAKLSLFIFVVFSLLSFFIGKRSME